MKDSLPRIARSAKTGQFVLNSDRAEKISAVEGMKLSGRMRAIVRDAKNGRFSGDEARALIKAEVRKRTSTK